MTSIPQLSLNNGPQIPQLGYGVFKIPNDETQVAVGAALDAGYRLIDTAAIYGNEEGVGAAIAESDIDRGDLFITSKLWNSEQGYDSTLAAFDETMNKLGLDVLDLYLIHWPLADLAKIVDTWKAFEKLHADGRIASIGVSNFTLAAFEKLFAETDIVPSINQIELHPQMAQSELRAFHADNGILTESWGPIGQGKGLLENEVVVNLAKAKDRSPAQVVLRWHLQLGVIALPKSSNPGRMAENIDIFDFELSDDDMATIAQLDTGTRLGPDPAEFNIA